MSKAIICTGGGAPSSIPPGFVEKDDFVIAADSGYDTAKRLGIPVHLWVGDYDSTLFSQEIQQLVHERSPRDKDESDTELAIKKAVSLGYASYCIIGGGGFRMDHLFATFSLFEQYGPPELWYTAYEMVHLVRGYHRFESLKAGRQVSFFPSSFSRDAYITAKQLQWPLENYRLSMDSLSLSNRTTDSFLDVFAKQGGLLFVSFPVADKLR